MMQIEVKICIESVRLRSKVGENDGHGQQQTPTAKVQAKTTLPTTIVYTDKKMRLSWAPVRVRSSILVCSCCPESRLVSFLSFYDCPTSNKLLYLFPYILLLVLRRCIYSSSFLPVSSLVDFGFHCVATYFELSSPPSDSVLPATDPRVTLRADPDTAPCTSHCVLVYQGDQGDFAGALVLHRCPFKFSSLPIPLLHNINKEIQTAAHRMCRRDPK